MKLQLVLLYVNCFKQKNKNNAKIKINICNFLDAFNPIRYANSK